MKMHIEEIERLCTFNLPVRAWLKGTEQMVDNPEDYAVDRYDMLGTGIYDRKGVMIFQGDILKKEANQLGPVIDTLIWIDGRFMLLISDCWPTKEELESCWEVIGNVFQNPDILKVV